MARPRTDKIDAPPTRRQTLAVTLTVAIACLPLVGHLVWQISGFVAMVVLVRLAALRWPGALPGRGPLFLLTLVGLLNCVVANHSLSGKAGGTALLVTMLALKLLELRERRDHRIIAIVLALLVVVQFLFGGGLGLTLFLALIVLVAVGLLVDLNGGLGETELRQTARVTMLLAAQAIPLTLVLFLLFPRLDAPLWSLGLDRETGLMGLGETMEPGSISELVINGDLAFRARFEGPVPAADRLYWRALVLWQVDDRRWTPGRQPGGSGPPRLEAAADLVAYTVLLEPSARQWLLTLDLPVEHPPDATLDQSFQLTAPMASSQMRRYRAVSALEHRTADASPTERRAALQLPPTVTPRERALVAEWASLGGGDWALVQAGLAYFAEEEFRYTLLPPRLGKNTWDQFLFETRSGFCEHFAGSFAVMMRAAGIPARVVLGYLGGEPNQIGGHLMIWQSDAHAWTEVLIANRGWVRVDPTTAIAASRIDRQGAERLLGAEAPARFHIDGGGRLARAIRQWRDLTDAIDAAWRDWVLDFSTDRQFQLLRHIGLETQGQWALVAVMVTAAALATLLMLAALLRQPQTPDTWADAYGDFCRRLARIGLIRATREGPRDFADRVAVARPDLAMDVAGITDIYVRGRYGPHPEREGIVALRRALRRFRPGRRPAYRRD